MSGLVGNSRRHVLSCRGSCEYKNINYSSSLEKNKGYTIMQLHGFHGAQYYKVLLPIVARQANLCRRAFRHDKF